MSISRDELESNNQRSIARLIIDYVSTEIKSMFPIFISSATRTDNKFSRHFKTVKSALDFRPDFNLSEKNRLEILANYFDYIYKNQTKINDYLKNNLKTNLHLGVGIATLDYPKGLHLHVDLRNTNSNVFFFETGKGIKSENVFPLEFEKLYKANINKNFVLVKKK